MTFVSLILLPFLAASAFGLPLDYAVGTVGDFGYGYDYGYGGLGNGFAGLGYGYGGLGYGYSGLGYGSVLASDYLDFGYPVGDFGSLGYPKAVDYARENFIRGNYFGATEVGTRDEVTVRPSYLRAPYSRFYSLYSPSNYYRGFNRFPFYGGYSAGRPSLLGRVAGDTVYLKR